MECVGTESKNFSVNKLCRVYVALTKNSGRYVFISSPTTFTRQLSQEKREVESANASLFIGQKKEL